METDLLKKIKIIRKRGVKKLSLTVSEKGINLTAPKLVPKFLILDFISKNKEWIFENSLKHKIGSGGERDFILKKPEAYKIIKKRVEYFSEKYQYKYNDIKIKNNSSSWGSCSKLKNLNFNYKVAFLPQNLMDYVVVHEICHLKELNHSRKFWDLVEKEIPNYKDLRKKLKAHLI